MVPFVLGALGTAASLYSIMQSVESTCSMVDDYIEDNVDIMTENPVMGYDRMTVLLRSKKERRALEAYNRLVLECLDLLMGSNIAEEWSKKPGSFKFTEEQLRMKFRIGAGFEHWWREGFSGQHLNGKKVLDPYVEGLFHTLTDSDKAVIARAHSLVVAAEGRGRK